MRTFRAVAGILTAAGLLIGTTACGGDSQPQQNNNVTTPVSVVAEAPPVSPGESTIIFDGKAYTCGQTIGAEGCGPGTQDAFDRYGYKLVEYVNSGKLGPLNDAQTFTFEDVAYAGLVACALADKGSANYVDYVAKNGGGELSKLSGVELLPAWFEAGRSLCPEVGFAA